MDPYGSPNVSNMLGIVGPFAGAISAVFPGAFRLLQAPKLTELEQLKDRKRKAVEVEDYESLVVDHGNMWGERDLSTMRHHETS